MGCVGTKLGEIATCTVLLFILVMRCSGTYKVLLNTTIWPNMTCELADKKSLRISAQDTDLTVKVFLIMVRSLCTVIRIILKFILLTCVLGWLFYPASDMCDWLSYKILTCYN